MEAQAGHPEKVTHSPMDAARIPEAHEAIGRLQSACERLDALTDSLTTRLNPVLRQMESSPNVNGGGDRTISPYSSEVAAKVGNCASAVDMACDRLVGLLDRLEV
jgi:hypothetical protein